MKISEDENFDKVSGGKSYKEYLKSIGITGLSGIMAFSGMGDHSRSSAAGGMFENLKDKISSKTEKLNPADAQALAIVVPSTLVVGSVGVWLMDRFIKMFSGGSPANQTVQKISTDVFSGDSPTNQTVQKFNTVRYNPASLEFGLRTPVEDLFSGEQDLFVAMETTYNAMSNRGDISSYGPTFWRQWYASFYVYVKFHLETKRGNVLALGFSDSLKEITTTVGGKICSGRDEVRCGPRVREVVEAIEMACRVAVTEDQAHIMFSKIESAPTPSLISSICQCDNKLEPRNLLALKIAIDQDWESIKKMSGNEFLNYAGSYTDTYRVI